MKVQAASTVLLLSVGMFASRAGADELFTTASFSGPVGQATGLNYFDPSLGTLDSVNVQINGELQGVVVTAGAGCSPVCVPAPYNVQVDQTFSGLGGQFFSFDTPAQFDFTGAGTIGEAFPLDTAFSYSFNFTSTTDLIGFTVPSFTGASVPPIDIVGSRSDFLTPLISLKEVDVASSLALASGVLDVEGLESDGSILITYSYTPAAAAVPEPGMLIPLVGFLLVFFARSVVTRRRSGRCVA